MRLGLFVSTLLHAAILGWVVISIANTPPKEAEAVKRIDVDIIQMADVTKIREGVRKPKKKADKPKPPAKKAKPKVAAATKKVAVLPPQKSEPKPEPKKEEPKEPEPKKVEKKPEPKPKPVVKKPQPKPKKVVEKPKPKPVKKVEKPKPKPSKVVRKKKPKPKPKRIAKKVERPAERKQPKRPEFDPNNIAALLNRLPDAPVEPTRNAPRRPVRNAAPEPTPSRSGQRDGRDQQLSISEKDALLRSLIRQVEGCWSPPTGVREARNLVVRIKFSMKQDGSLVGTPQVLNPASSSLFIAASSAAVRAIYECQPYQLPRELYSNWRDATLNFNPSQMLGG